MESLKIYAPVSGKVTSLTEVPDPAFSQAMLGDGIAVKPDTGLVVAPFDGTVTTLHKNLHAVTLSDGNSEILIHIGVETVALGGKGFEAFVKPGAKVKRGDKLIKFDVAYVAAHADSDLVVVIVTNPLQSNLIKTKDSTVKAGESFLLGLGAAGVEAEIAECGETIVSSPIKILNAHGLHARPAGVLANAAAKYKSRVEIEFNGARANAKSIVAIMGLGLDKGSVITLYASGEDASAALAYLTSEISRGLGEETDRRVYTSTAAAPEENIDFTKTATLKSVSAAPGTVIGKAFVITEEKLVIPAGSRGVEEETKALVSALAVAKENIEDTILFHKDKKVYKEILTAHITILEDPYLIETAKTFITQGENAASAFSGAVEKSITILAGGANALIKERIADYKDINRKVFNILTGVKPTPPDIKPGSVLITGELLPNDVLTLHPNVAGVICAEGSATSHASIMLKNIGMPSIVSAGARVLKCPQGTDIILDAAKGAAVFNPDGKTLSAAKEQYEKTKKTHEENKKHAFEPAVTRDGVRIKVEGNVGSAEEAAGAKAAGAEGIGLVRTEFMFRNRAETPDAEEQYQSYKELARAAGGPVTFRTFDVGGDKPLPFMLIPQEENPILGLRGVRNYGLNRQLIWDQTRAFARLSAETKILVMVPMVGFLDEFEKVKDMFGAARKEYGIKEHVPVGITVEIPSVALMADKFIETADFFSLGTNDLTQYTLAIDRGHSQLSAAASSLNPAVLKLIELTSKTALKAGKGSAVCGGMASELYNAPLLIGLGVRELAVSSSAIADIKAVIRTLDMKKCEDAAARALKLSTADQVRELIKKEFGL
ncbi:MAG: phosphoenolpyruvate--protein phosphotransferase [Elusimicrobia bacterium]|nr:phosphoenolpyruvate--protein phosphotransferase [Elusimicrobiota bacterium]